ncbi:MAG: hypothetical protein D6706_21245 [Chloroflexi bacterium]|nr:MAG: hypothetical protein D6706_21245 [Chloroflexota bacterium]
MFNFKIKNGRIVSGDNRPLTRNPGCLLLIGLIPTIIGLAFLIPTFSSGEYFFLLFGCVPILVGLGFIAWAGFNFITQQTLGKPEVLISNTTLAVGEPFTVQVIHTFRRGLQVDRVLAQLVFRETATYQQGTDTRTVTHEEIIEETEWPGGYFSSGHFFQNSVEMQIPRDGMHTLNVRRNQLQWFVRLKMEIPRLPDYIEEHELIVLPKVYGGVS